jgi:hypothetical protein
MKQDYMDLTITIVGDRLHTSLFEKPMALYLYIPPHSAHPPGCWKGQIYGEVLRIHRLCSDEDDITNRVITCFRRWTARGHSPQKLVPVFKRALENARKFMATSKEQREANKAAKLEEARRRVYFHTEYHPQGPPSREIQQLFDNTVMNPPGKDPFQSLGWTDTDIPLDSMIVCYHRPLNLENLLSYRNLCKQNGPPVSSFLDE